MKLNITAITSLNPHAIQRSNLLNLKCGAVRHLGQHVEGVRVVHGVAWITAETEFYAIKEGHVVYFRNQQVPHTLSAGGKSGLIVELL